MARKAEVNANVSAVSASSNIVYESFFMLSFFSICLSIFKICLLGSVNRWFSPSHIKADARLWLREGSPVTAGGAATILTQGLILLGVCVCVCVWEREGETEQDKKMMHSGWNLPWLFNIRHPEFSSPPFSKFTLVSNIRNYLHLESTPFLPLWQSAQSV